jgi:hypothetical protein
LTVCSFTIFDISAIAVGGKVFFAGGYERSRAVSSAESLVGEVIWPTVK